MDKEIEHKKWLDLKGLIKKHSGTLLLLFLCSVVVSTAFFVAYKNSINDYQLESLFRIQAEKEVTAEKQEKAEKIFIDGPLFAFYEYSIKDEKGSLNGIDASIAVLSLILGSCFVVLFWTLWKFIKGIIKLYKEKNTRICAIALAVLFLVSIAVMILLRVLLG